MSTEARSGAARARCLGRSELAPPALNGLCHVAEAATLIGQLVGHANRGPGLHVPLHEAAGLELLQARGQNFGTQPGSSISQFTKAPRPGRKGSQNQRAPRMTENIGRELKRLALAIDRLGHEMSLATALSKGKLLLERKSIDRRNYGRRFQELGSTVPPASRHPRTSKDEDHGILPCSSAHPQRVRSAPSA
jgi:hypothetical protein